MKKWKEMRLKFLKRCWFSCKAFPLYSPVQTETPQQVWNGAPFTFRTVALYRKWRTNEKSRWRLLQKSKLEPYSVEWPGKIFRSHAWQGWWWVGLCSGGWQEERGSQNTPGFPPWWGTQAAFVLWVLSLSACRVFFSVLSRSVISNSVTPRMGVCQAPLSMGIFPGKNTGVSCHFFFQEIFPTQELNLYVLHLLLGRQILHWWTTWEAHGEV